MGIDRHKYLIKWKKNESDVINQMVYRLKANNSLPAWSYYSRQFVKKININFKEYAGLVPIPGSKKESVHSWIFAKELSLLTGMPVLDILVKKNETTEQKKLSAYERANSQTIDLRSHQPELFTKCIFVDDVLTTGQSFFQSNRAVNGLNENIVLTLFYRGRGE